MFIQIFASLALTQATPDAAPPPPIFVRENRFESNEHYMQLDKLLSDNAHNELLSTLFTVESQQEANANLDWLGAGFKRGEPPYIAWAYARFLIEIARTLPPAQGDNLKGTALAAMLYAISSARIEAEQCGDATARSDRMQQFVTQLKQSDLLTLNERKRGLAALIALDIERKTWERRKSADSAAFLCANGMAAMSAGIAAGNVNEAQPEKGQFGRQIEVQPPTDFVYERRDNGEWWPEAEKLRQAMPSLVIALAEIERLPTITEATEEASGN